MCTAVSYCPKDHYFGRNLDLERSYNECITITPRNFSLSFRNGILMRNHLALIGMAASMDHFPLYYEATNEAGLSMAALNFPGNAHYFPPAEGKQSIASFELIPYILAKYESAKEAVEAIAHSSISNEQFSSAYPASPLHWLLADRDNSFVIESTKSGLHCYDNPIGVLTNNPPFPYHLYNLSNHMSLTPEPPVNRQPISLSAYSLGMGAFGLPGDLSSGSRFIKAAFTKMHSVCGDQEEAAVSQFFHILSSVAQQMGCTKLNTGEFEFTIYSSCCNTDKGIYYYTTYYNPQISSVSLHHENLDSSDLICYEINRAFKPFRHN